MSGSSATTSKGTASARPLLVVLLFLIAFIQPSFAVLEKIAPKCEDSQLMLSLRGSESWVFLAVLAIIASYTIVSFAYMLSRAFGQSPLEGWARNEAYQTTANLIIVFLIFVLANIEYKVFESFGYDVTAPTANPAITKGITYLQHVWSFTAENVANAYIAHTALQLGASQLDKTKDLALGIENVFVLVPGLRISGNKLGDKFGYQGRNVFTLIISPLTMALTLTTAQIWFMCITDAFAFSLILPIGIILRIMPFSRGIGSAFIAIAIGFYLVYPLTLLMNEKVVEFVKDGDSQWWEKTNFMSSAGFAAGSTVLFGLSKVPKLSHLSLLKLGSVAAALLSLVVAITDMIPAAAFSSAVLGAFFPFINIVITFGFTREFAKVLGTDVNLNSILKVL